MKIRLLVAATIGILALTVAGAPAQSGSELFLKARLKQNTEGDMVEAIRIYQTIVTEYSTDRSLAASALLQIGLCYQKLGKTEEARRAFDRIVLEYKDQKVRAEAIAHLDALDRDLSAEHFGALRGSVIFSKGILVDSHQEDGLVIPHDWDFDVYALKEVYADGRRVLTSTLFTQTKTNKGSGEWTLSPLRPGRYYVAVTLMGGTELVFFPNTLDWRGAKLVEVRPDSTTSNLDIRPFWRSDRRVRGRVTGGPFGGPEDPVTEGTLRVLAIPKHNLPTPFTQTQEAQVGRDGSFTFGLMRRGSYLLSANQGAVSRGRVDIEVGDKDIENVSIAVSPALTLSGRIVLDPKPPAVPYFLGDLDFRVVLRHDPTFSEFQRFSYARVANDGSFTISRVQKGNYRVSVMPILNPPTLPEGVTPTIPQTFVRTPQALEDAYVKSIRLGQADVLNDGLHLDEQPQQEIVIVIGSNPGTLEGRVVNARKEPVRNATVVLIPQGGIRFRVDHKFTATETAGRFRIERIPPGDYKLFAWRDVESGAWQDPAFVQAFETRGKPIHIEEGGRHNVEVLVIPPDR